MAEQNKPLEYTHVAYGWFYSPITIYWTKASGQTAPHTVEHTLCFDNGGKWKTISLKFSREKLSKIFPKEF